MKLAIVGTGYDCILEHDPLINLSRDGELNAYKHYGFCQCMDILKEKIYLNELWQSNNAPWELLWL